jgi:LPS O-antigen subunit length determinant protein (WzzB/FepE family)
MPLNGTGNHKAVEQSGVRSESFDLVALGRVIAHRWKPIFLSAAIPALLTFLFTKYAMTPTWAATANVRPVNKQAQMMEFMGLSQGSLLGSLGGVTSFLGFSKENEEAEEYTSIFQSYDFTLNVIRKHQLADYLLLDRGPWYSPGRWISWITGAENRKADPWLLYLNMQGRFDCEYDTDTGNLDLSFIDKSPLMARKVLGWYISDLQEMLRAQQVRSASNAMISLRDEARRTADVYLQSQLYMFSAAQLQNLKMAEAEADFAFKVIQSPVVPNRPHSPRPMLDAAILGSAGLLSAILWILLATSPGPDVSDNEVVRRHADKPLERQFTNGEMPPGDSPSENASSTLTKQRLAD